MTLPSSYTFLHIHYIAPFGTLWLCIPLLALTFHRICLTYSRHPLEFICINYNVPLPSILLNDNHPTFSYLIFPTPSFLPVVLSNGFFLVPLHPFFHIYFSSHAWMFLRNLTTLPTFILQVKNPHYKVPPFLKLAPSPFFYYVSVGVKLKLVYM
mgnify:FL=1